MRVELITWVDATSQDDWTDLNEAADLKTHTMFSIGFVLKEHKDRLVIALTWDADGEQVSQFLSIPKGWILDRREIKNPGFARVGRKLKK